MRRRERARAFVAASFVASALVSAPAAAREGPLSARERTGKPNDALFCSDCAAEADAPSLRFDASVERAREAWRAALAAEPRTAEIEAGEGYALHRQSSAVFGFVDLIEAEFVETEGGVEMRLYSRSLTGYWDFGVNRARLDRLARALEAELAR